MLIEDLIFETTRKKDSLKHINNYVIDEMSENWHSYEGVNGEIYNKIMGLLHANSLVIDSLEKILISYLDELNSNYTELLKTEI